MALVSGQTLSSFAELNTTPYTELSAAEDSDDEYVYVSSLAEQIAHALLLLDDDDDDVDAPPAALPSNSFQPELQCREDIAWPRASLRIDKADLETKNSEVMCPVSHFAAAWRDHGPTEWDCFYTPSPQQASRQLSTQYSTQLEHSFSKHRHLFRGWNSDCLASNKQVVACSRETRDGEPLKTPSTAYIVSSPPRKESIGTGVFLPKIVNSGSHYRRKTGFGSSKSAYALRYKC